MLRGVMRGSFSAAGRRTISARLARQWGASGEQWLAGEEQMATRGLRSRQRIGILGGVAALPYCCLGV